LYALFLIAVLESFSRFIFSTHLIPATEIKDDGARRIDWVKKHSQQNWLYYSFDVYNPQRGWALAANIRSETLNSNSKGIRGMFEYLYEKPKNKIRILVLGDSFTFVRGYFYYDSAITALRHVYYDYSINFCGIHFTFSQ
jgi:hypothetical protein